MSRALQIKDYPEYYVTDTGDVYSRKSNNGKVIKLKPQKTWKGYLRVHLRNNNGPRHKPIHRLVAEAFIPNPDNKPEVNHKDGNKKNNYVGNLEWCTGSENMRHAFDVLQRKPASYYRTKKRLAKKRDV